MNAGQIMQIADESIALLDSNLKKSGLPDSVSLTIDRPDQKQKPIHNINLSFNNSFNTSFSKPPQPGTQKISKAHEKPVFSVLDQA